MRDLKRGNAEAVAKAEASAMVGMPTHPIATVAGALVFGAAAGALIFGAAAGAAAGTAVGPIGTVIGAVVGAVVAGLGSDAVAASIEETPHTECWRQHDEARPCVEKGASFDDFGPAHNDGHGARNQVQSRGASSLAWDLARKPPRDAWDRPALGTSSTR